MSRLNPLISIIVPVYQVKPYLRECLDSIIEQTFTDWEMLLVDDGSTDGGERICDEFGKKDTRIRVFHQENQGLSAARNVGLNNACGQYLTMIDSDDVLATPRYLQLLYEALVENDADMSVCGHIRFNDGIPTPVAISVFSGTKICSGRDFYYLLGFDRYLDSVDVHGNALSIGHTPICSTGKLYKREMFEHIRYPVGHVLEDSAVAHRVYYCSKRVAVLGICMYAFRKRVNSIINSTKSDVMIQERIYACEDAISFSLEIGDKELTEYAVKELRKLVKKG